MGSMKRILLGVCGLNPQVITETLYALLLQGRSVHEIHMITTYPGYEKLLSFIAPSGPLMRFLEEYNLPHRVSFPPENIYILRDESGEYVEDVEDEVTNYRLIELCLEVTFKLCSHPENIIYFLVAGGRKTMSSCLSLAAQLYGRPQDRIYHVLVSREFESSKNFWYPPKRSRSVLLYDDRGNPYKKETKYAKIQLVSIPFFPVRHWISEEQLKGPLPPSEIISHVIMDKDSHLIVDIKNCRICFGSMETDLHPAYMALYAWFLKNKKRCMKDRPCGGCIECFVDASTILSSQSEIMYIYNSIPGSRDIDSLSGSGIKSLTRENFNSYKSKIKSILIKSFGLSVYEKIGIVSVGRKPDTRFGIRIDRSRIRFI